MQPSVHYVHEPAASIDIGPHVFPTEKYDVLARLLREELQVGPQRFHGWEAVDDGDLARVHTPSYLADLRDASPTWRTLTSELPVERPIIDGFRRMAGGSIAAVRLGLDHGLGFHIGGGFHHAFAEHAEGFCYLHDMAIAVERLRFERDLQRVLFVDTDVHQGNGTAAIYSQDAHTFTFSMHQENNYPEKQRSDLDFGLEDGVADEEYLAVLAQCLELIDQRFDPQLVCYVAGVDPFGGDLLGGLSLSEAGLERRDEMVLTRFAARGIPMAVFLAGGYAPSPEQTARLHLGTARAAERACALGTQPEGPS